VSASKNILHVCLEDPLAGGAYVEVHGLWVQGSARLAWIQANNCQSAPTACSIFQVEGHKGVPFDGIAMHAVQRKVTTH
jgi:hypothetical protein